MAGHPLLNPDDSASMATMVLMVHHGLRRDAARLAGALRELGPADAARAARLREAFAKLATTLHEHHLAEDERMFPGIRQQRPELAGSIDALASEHREIDPLLARAEQAFAALPAGRDEASAATAALAALLDRHLAHEEEALVAVLRAVPLSAMPPMPEPLLAGFADGFAWGAEGVAADVVEKLLAAVPDAARAKIPDALAAQAERATRLWGAAARGATRTSVPADA